MLLQSPLLQASRRGHGIPLSPFFHKVHMPRLISLYISPFYSSFLFILFFRNRYRLNYSIFALTLSDCHNSKRKGSNLFRLLKNPSHVIARSSFCDEAISNPLILLKARLPRFALNDRKKTFSTACKDLTLFLCSAHTVDIYNWNLSDNLSDPQYLSIVTTTSPDRQCPIKA